MSWNKRRKQDLQAEETVYPAALEFLARREYAESELRSRLQQRGAEEKAIDQALARLTQQGYLDAQRFALSRVRERREFNHRGRAYIQRELRELEISEDIIQIALDEEYPPEVESALLEQLIRREVCRWPKDAPPEKLRKLTASLQRRCMGQGFPAGEIYRLLRQVKEAGWEAEEEI